MNSVKIFQIEAYEVMQINLVLGAAVAEALVQPSIPSLEARQKEWLKRVHCNHYHLHDDYKRKNEIKTSYTEMRLLKKRNIAKSFC